jgi:uracil-DNA glycosylase
MDRLMTVQELQQEMYRDYAAGIGLDPDASYVHGTPLRPVVPLDTAIGVLFILGAYPSARFGVVNGITDVPVADNLGPFESERWFDGSRVRHQPSAHELDELFLKPLLLRRSDCWITDLVKVFLFKPGHVNRYRDEKIAAEAPAGYTRDRFFELGSNSENLKWLEKELLVAKPSYMITLGAEVAGVLRGVSSSEAQTKLLSPESVPLSIGSASVHVMHCAHPGILMRKEDPRNPWPLRHRDEFIPALKRAQQEFGFLPK